MDGVLSTVGVDYWGRDTFNGGADLRFLRTITST
jgi:hypothetical protein